ncbi:MAG: hypothetical protein H0W07_08690 [Chloroflexi bacterium]|nr:hypothetical protein [Chloroflexota bacterium]
MTGTPLIDQLADGGRLVSPVVTRTHQELRGVRRMGDRVEWRSVEPRVCVPLIGRFGFRAGR